MSHDPSERPRRTFTDEIVSDEMAAVLRKKTPWERLEIAFGLWDFARDLIRATIRREHPEWDDAEVQREVARRMSHGAV